MLPKTATLTLIFGNLDPTYDDITEPQLLFDPENDDIPMS